MSCATSLVLLLLASAPTLPVPPPPASPATRLASHLVSGIFAEPDIIPSGALYDLSVRASEGAPARLSDYIADHIESAVVRRKRGATRYHAGSELEPTHRLSVELIVRRARVDARARLVRLPGSFWEKLRLPQGVVLSTSLASAPMDLELRVLSGRPRLGVSFKRLRYVDISSRSAVELREAPVLDMIHADLDGDGLNELVCLQSERLLTLRWNASRLDLIDQSELEQSAEPVARLRQPIGRLMMLTRADGSLRLLVASSSRPSASLWRYGRDRWHMVDVAPAKGHWPLYALGAERWLTQGRMSENGALRSPTIGLVEAASKGYVEQALQPAFDEIYALRAFPFFGAATPSWSPFLVMSSPARGLSVWAAQEPNNVLELSDAGDAAVICDLDANGAPELIHTSSALEGADRLTLLEMGTRVGARERWSRTSEHPVTAMTTSDLDEDGFQEVVVASWSASKGNIHLISPLVRP